MSETVVLLNDGARDKEEEASKIGKTITGFTLRFKKLGKYCILTYDYDNKITKLGKQIP